MSPNHSCRSACVIMQGGVLGMREGIAARAVVSIGGINPAVISW